MAQRSDVKIIRLSLVPEYLDEMADALYEEWYESLSDKGYNTKEDVCNFYRDMMRYMFVAVDDGNRFVGCYSLIGFVIGDVFVAKEQRGKGLGRLLIEDAIRRHWYLYKLELVSATKTVAFYEIFGFKMSHKTDDGDLWMVRYNYVFFSFATFVCLVAAILI